MKREVTHADCYRAVDDHMATLKTDAEKQAFVVALQRKFLLRCERNLKAALSRPVPDLDEVRRWNQAVREMRQDLVTHCNASVR
jgi:hypothetical protein